MMERKSIEVNYNIPSPPKKKPLHRCTSLGSTGEEWKTDIFYDSDNPHSMSVDSHSSSEDNTQFDQSCTQLFDANPTLIVPHKEVNDLCQPNEKDIAKDLSKQQDSIQPVISKETHTCDNNTYKSVSSNSNEGSILQNKNRLSDISNTDNSKKGLLPAAEINFTENSFSHNIYSFSDEEKDLVTFSSRYFHTATTGESDSRSSVCSQRSVESHKSAPPATGRFSSYLSKINVSVGVTQDIEQIISHPEIQQVTKEVYDFIRQPTNNILHESHLEKKSQMSLKDNNLDEQYLKMCSELSVNEKLSSPEKTNVENCQMPPIDINLDEQYLKMCSELSVNEKPLSPEKTNVENCKIPPIDNNLDEQYLKMCSELSVNEKTLSPEKTNVDRQGCELYSPTEHSVNENSTIEPAPAKLPTRQIAKRTLAVKINKEDAVEKRSSVESVDTSSSTSSSSDSSSLSSTSSTSSSSSSEANMSQSKAEVKIKQSSSSARPIAAAKKKTDENNNVNKSSSSSDTSSISDSSQTKTQTEKSASKVEEDSSAKVDTENDSESAIPMEKALKSSIQYDDFCDFTVEIPDNFVPFPAKNASPKVASNIEFDISEEEISTDGNKKKENEQSNSCKSANIVDAKIETPESLLATTKPVTTVAEGSKSVDSEMLNETINKSDDNIFVPLRSVTKVFPIDLSNTPASIQCRKRREAKCAKESSPLIFNNQNVGAPDDIQNLNAKEDGLPLKNSGKSSMIRAENVTLSASTPLKEQRDQTLDPTHNDIKIFRPSKMFIDHFDDHIYRQPQKATSLSSEDRSLSEDEETDSAVYPQPAIEHPAQSFAKDCGHITTVIKMLILKNPDLERRLVDSCKEIIVDLASTLCLD